jgi:putative flippase GtrA
MIGIITNFLGYVLYLLITFVGATPKLTMSVLYAAGATINFFANKSLTFSHTGSTMGAGFRYAICYALGYLINFSILAVMVDELGYPHQLVQAVAIFIVAIFLFLGCKYYVFAKTDT